MRWTIFLKYVIKYVSSGLQLVHVMKYISSDLQLVHVMKCCPNKAVQKNPCCDKVRKFLFMSPLTSLYLLKLTLHCEPSARHTEKRRQN